MILTVLVTVSFAQTVDLVLYPFEKYPGYLNKVENRWVFLAGKPVSSGSFTYTGKEFIMHLDNKASILYQPVITAIKSYDDYVLYMYDMIDSGGKTVSVKFHFYKTGITEIYLYMKDIAMAYKCKSFPN